MKKRKLYYKLMKFIEHKNALIVTGMRQVGKTTLLKQIYDNLKISEKIWIYHYDIAIVDITLPGGSGLQLIEKLKQIHTDTGICKQKLKSNSFWKNNGNSF